MAKHKDYIQNLENVERRFYGTPAEVRMDDATESRTIEGYAALFNNQTVIGDYFREEILPGAFDEVLNDDVRCLFNHDPNFVLARSVNGEGTLSLSVDDKGLKYRYETPNVTYAKDLEENIRLGNINSSSFAFGVGEQKWVEARNEDELPLRQLVKFSRLPDVSPVTYPAYPDASVGKRSLDAFKAENIEVTEPKIINQSRTKTVHEAQVIINKNKV